jgi:hypothetical protein
MTVISNLFGTDAGSTLLLFKIEPEYWGVLKTFMNFLNMLPIGELKEIEEDKEVKKVLEKL